MNTAPSQSVVVDTRPTASDRAQLVWIPQTQVSHLHYRRRRARVFDLQCAWMFTGSIVAALTFPSWWGPALMISGWIVPAVGAAWLDTYRPVRRPRQRRPGSHDLAIAIHLDQGETK